MPARILVRVSAEPIPFPPARRRRIDPARFATAQRALFAGQHLHIGRSRIVHSVAWVEWLEGLLLPAPACRQGWAGTGAHGELQPTRWPVTCRKCRRLAGGRPDEAAAELALFSLG